MGANYDYSVFIGKFLPHEGHMKIVHKALEYSDYLIMVPGSAARARDTRIPFTVKERISFIQAMLDYHDIDRKRVLFTSVPDFPYNELKWNAEVQRAVYEVIHEHTKTSPKRSRKGWSDYPQSIALAGMKKDNTSYYLHNFPRWNAEIGVQPAMCGAEIISSTHMRQMLFFGNSIPESYVPRPVSMLMYEAIDKMGNDWKRLLSDFNYEANYESQWGKGPHTTVDSIVTQAGHVLLGTRGQEYGHGLLCTPGGFVEKGETISEARIRELREETGLKVPSKVLLGSTQVGREVYDDPYRSNRGHIITHVAHYALDSLAELPKVKAASDLKNAEWMEISKIIGKPELFFEDHYHILADRLGF